MGNACRQGKSSIFAGGISSAYLSGMLVDSALKVYNSGSTNIWEFVWSGREFVLLHRSNPGLWIVLCRTKMYVGGEGTVGSAGFPVSSILTRHMLPGGGIPISTHHTACQGAEELRGWSVVYSEGERWGGLFRSRWDDRCGVDHPGSGTASGWLGPDQNGFSWVLDGSTLAVLGELQGYPVGVYLCHLHFPFW